jgi:hypothetical protein
MLDWDNSPIRGQRTSIFGWESPVLYPPPEDTLMDSPWYKEFKNNFNPGFKNWTKLLPKLDLEFTDQYTGCYCGYWSLKAKSTSQEAISMIYNYLNQLLPVKVTTKMNSQRAQNDLKVNTYSTTICGTYDLRTYSMNFEKFVRIRLRNPGYLSVEKIFTHQ